MVYTRVMDIITNRDVASPVFSLVKPESASGVVTLDLPACRGFAANDPIVHRGCSDCSYDGASEAIVYNHFRYYDPTTGRYIQSDRIGLGDGPNTYSYARQNPLFYSDPQGLAVCGGVCITGVAIGIGRLGQIGFRAYQALQAARALQGLVDGLNDRTDADGISVPSPPRKRGKYSCICRVQKDGRSPDNCSNNNKNFGYGYGVADDLRTAKRMAEKMAKDTLGAKSTHHPQCRCTGPTGDPIIPHG